MKMENYENQTTVRAGASHTGHGERVVVRIVGTLDETATQRAVEHVRRRATRETTLVIVSLTAATDVRWSALCRLARAVRAWRAACLNVVVETARPSVRELFATAGT